MKLLLGIVVAFSLGVGSRLLDIPAPAPPEFTGLVMILAITTGYVLTDDYLSDGESAEQPVAQASETHRPAPDSNG